MDVLKSQSIMQTFSTSMLKGTNYLQSTFEQFSSFGRVTTTEGEKQHTGKETKTVNGTTTLTTTISHFAFIEKVCERAIRNLQEKGRNSITKLMDSEQNGPQSDNEEGMTSSGDEASTEGYYFTLCERSDSKKNMLETRHIEKVSTTVNCHGNGKDVTQRMSLGNREGICRGRERATIGYGRSLSDPLFEKSSVYKQSNKPGILSGSVTPNNIKRGKSIVGNSCAGKQENGHHQGTMKLSMQYFENTNQLRVIALTAEDIQSSNGKVKAEISLHGPEAISTESSRKTYMFGGKAQFNDNFYFDVLNDDLAEYIIKIKLKKTRHLFASRTIGEITIALGDLTLNLDTTFLAPVYRNQKSDKITLDAKDLQLSSLKRSIQEDILASLEMTETMQLRSSLKRVRSLPVMKRHGTILL